MPSGRRWTAHVDRAFKAECVGEGEQAKRTQANQWLDGLLGRSYVGVATWTSNVHWIWDEEKSRLNRRKHGLSFDTAQLVFGDPLMVHRRDLGLDEERWHTIGMVGGVVLIVAHTWPAFVPGQGDEVGRIISARKATPRERRAYEEGHFE